jgi:hypothetical protein
MGLFCRTLVVWCNHKQERESQMGYLEMFEMNENGAGWVSFESVSFADKVELQLGLDTNNYTLACVVCLVPIKSGMGHSYCDRHNPRKEN